jgi:hypothetical protein
MSWRVGSAGIFIVEPTRPSSGVQTLIAEAKKLARDLGLDSRSRKAETISVVGGPGRKAEVLTPTDAGGLYKRLHLEPTLVLAFTAILVRRDPSRNPPTRRDAIRLEDFVRYKAPYHLARGVEDLRDALGRLSEWCTEVGCDGDGDPRIIPLHLFPTLKYPDRLADPAETSRFNAEHGAAAERTDAKGRSWKRASRRAYHGQGDRYVAGELLPEGMHWDVSGFGRDGVLANCENVWVVKDPRSYLNIYPDGHVRLPARHRARRVWPR